MVSVEKSTVLSLNNSICSLEYWAFEILVFLAGLMKDAETTTSLIAMWYDKVPVSVAFDLYFVSNSDL